MPALWIKGMILGFSIAAPVGPIGLLCIRRSLAQGRLAGFLSGLGAATADGLYGSLAAFGLTAVFSMLASLQDVLHVLGGLFLLWLGWRMLQTPPAEQAATVKTSGKGYAGAYLSTLLLTLSNPMTIFSFLAVFSGAGLQAATDANGSALWMVLGVFCGSALWWLILSNGITFLAKRMDEPVYRKVLIWVNRLAGLGIMGFAMLQLAQFLMGKS